MIRGLYTVRDDASGLYMSLIVNDSDAVAIRGFDYALTSNELMKFRPDDYSLWCVGSFDDVTGIVKGDSPTCLKRGVKRGKQQ